MPKTRITKLDKHNDYAEPPSPQKPIPEIIWKALACLLLGCVIILIYTVYGINKDLITFKQTTEQHESDLVRTLINHKDAINKLADNQKALIERLEQK